MKRVKQIICFIMIFCLVMTENTVLATNKDVTAIKKEKHRQIIG